MCCCRIAIRGSAFQHNRRTPWIALCGVYFNSTGWSSSEPSLNRRVECGGGLRLDSSENTEKSQLVSGTAIGGTILTGWRWVDGLAVGKFAAFFEEWNLLDTTHKRYTGRAYRNC